MSTLDEHRDASQTVCYVNFSADDQVLFLGAAPPRRNPDFYRGADDFAPLRWCVLVVDAELPHGSLATGISRDPAVAAGAE